jgi:putative tricarboxylic transport membrane protein
VADAYEIMAPASPGGGWDRTARALAVSLSRESGRTASVYNVPGAGGTIGLAQFVHDDRGDPHALMIGGLVMLGAERLHHSPITLDRTIPIATLASEWEAIVVPTASHYVTLRQLTDDLIARPESVGWGGGSAGGTDHLLVALVARAAGADVTRVNYVAYAGGGEALSAMLSGAVTAGVSGVSEVRDQIMDGRLRALAVSSDRRVAAIDAPTLREAGIDVTLSNWRGVFAPPGLDDAQQATLVAAVRAAHDTPEWKRALEQAGWDDAFRTGPALTLFLDAERARVEAVTLLMEDRGHAVIGPYTLPAAAGGGLVVSLLWFVVRRRTDRVLIEHVAAEHRQTDVKKLALLAGALCLYAALLRPAGYIVATALFFPAVARQLGSKRPLRDVVAGILLATAIFFAFTRLLGVRLP